MCLSSDFDVHTGIHMPPWIDFQAPIDILVHLELLPRGSLEHFINFLYNCKFFKQVTVVIGFKILNLLNIFPEELLYITSFVFGGVMICNVISIPWLLN